MVNYMQYLHTYISQFFFFFYSLTVAGEDFTFSGMLMFQFTTGPSPTACINIDITDDFDYEGDHSFAVTLSETAGPPIGSPGPVKRTATFSSPSGPLIGPNSQTTVTVNDSEGMISYSCYISQLKFIAYSVYIIKNLNTSPVAIH